MPNFPMSSTRAELGKTSLARHLCPNCYPLGFTKSQKYSWEATYITSIVAAITTLAFVTHLTGTPRVDTHPPASATAALSVPSTPPAPLSSHPGATASRHSDPREVVVGPTGISNRYTLLRMDRKPISPTKDELIIRLHVDSLATEPLVSPFESDMLALSGWEMEPINPKTKFRHPVTSGNSLNQDVVFSIPSTLDLNRTTLQIHYYNYQNEIPLSVLAAERHPPR